MTEILIYCDDPSHTATPLGPIITDPNPVMPDDVYTAAEFIPPDAGDTRWRGREYVKGELQPPKTRLVAGGAQLELSDEIAIAGAGIAWLETLFQIAEAKLAAALDPAPNPSDRRP